MQGFRELILLHLAHEAERRAHRAQQDLSKRIEAHETGITESRAALEAAEEEVKRLLHDRRAAELDVQKLEDTRKKYREQLMSAKTNEIYKINADRVIDFNANYAITTPAGKDLGHVRRHGMRSLWRARPKAW